MGVDCGEDGKGGDGGQAGQCDQGGKVDDGEEDGKGDQGGDRLFTASLFTHTKEKASRVSAKHVGWDLRVK